MGNKALKFITGVCRVSFVVLILIFKLMGVMTIFFGFLLGRIFYK